VKNGRETGPYLQRPGKYTDLAASIICRKIEDEVSSEQEQQMGGFTVRLGIKSVLTYAYIAELEVMQKEGNDRVQGFIRKVSKAILYARSHVNRPMTPEVSLFLQGLMVSFP